MGRRARENNARREREQQKTESVQASPADLELKAAMWVVAFVDLLGYQEDLLSTDIFPVPSGPDAGKQIAGLFQNAIERHRSLRDGPDQFFAGVNRHESDMPTGYLRELRERMAKVKIRVTKFSDSFFMECSLAPAQEHFPMAAVFNIVAASSSTLFLHLSLGSPVRGGIDLALGLEMEGHVYTSATAKAVTLEKAAKFPRLLVGDRFREFLDTFIRSGNPDPEFKVEQQLAIRLNNLLYQDEEDQLWGVDYLGAAYRDTWGRSIPATMVQGMLTFARASKAKFKADKREKEEVYYDRLISYVESRLSVWGLEST